MMVLGDQIIETPNVIRSRSQETYSYRTLADGIYAIRCQMDQRAQTDASGLTL